MVQMAQTKIVPITMGTAVSVRSDLKRLIQDNAIPTFGSREVIDFRLEMIDPKRRRELMKIITPTKFVFLRALAWFFSPLGLLSLLGILGVRIYFQGFLLSNIFMSLGMVLTFTIFLCISFWAYAALNFRVKWSRRLVKERQVPPHLRVIFAAMAGYASLQIRVERMSFVGVKIYSVFDTRTLESEILYVCPVSRRAGMVSLNLS